MPNLLATSKGRLLFFFLLYIGEGLPQGYTGTVVALEFKRLGMDAQAIAGLMVAVTAPWAWKWLAGPIVDNLHLTRFGRRKQWIVGSQLLMILSLLAAISFFPQAQADGSYLYLKLFTALLIINSVFSAIQDVAIDALACGTLQEEERGLGNGLMFAGAQAGAALGGSVLLLLKGQGMSLNSVSILVPLMLLIILAIVILFAAEKTLGVAEQPAAAERAWRQVGAELQDYGRTVLKAFFGRRAGLLLLLFVLLPVGGMALSLTLGTIISPMLGMNDEEIGKLGLWSTLVFCFSCVAGGKLSDHFGRRRCLALFCLGMSLVTLWTAWELKKSGWSHFSTPPVDGQWPQQPELIRMWWISSLIYSLFFGLMYGIRTALVMDFMVPKVAATQFTACMALMNLVTVYSYAWQGRASDPIAKGGWGWEAWQVFTADALLGLLFVFLLPFLKSNRAQ
ncbi:MAG: hypothetical protein RL095_3979 [Verrucomicrobiota bacterium]|jgi:PAT family beta-lactamase induction signal transducer AmpG